MIQTLMHPREYQRTDARRCWESLRRSRRVLYTLPTGAGKTVVAVILVRRALTEGKRVLFVAHRRELIDQAVERLRAAGLAPQRIGVIMGKDARTRPDAPVQVASVQTLSRREKPAADLVIIDEAHRAAADTYKRIRSFYPRAWELGLTATPFRGNGAGLEEHFDELVIGAKASELIAYGFLSEPRTFTAPAEHLPDVSRVRRSGGDYNIADLGRVTNRRELVAPIVATWLERSKDRPTVVFAVDVDHAKRICAEFIAAGVNAEHIDNETSIDERAAILNRLRAQETKVVTNCQILTEGWDFPDLGCIVCARPTRSEVLWLQMTGRIMRPGHAHPHNADRPVILDHAGNALLFGLPQWDREVSLHSRKSSRRGHDPAKRCPSCGETIRALDRVCSCGYVFWELGAPPVIDGKLIELDAKPAKSTCAGWGGKACDKATPAYSTAPCRVAKRRGEPWRCSSCALRRAAALLDDTAKKRAADKRAVTAAHIDWSELARRREASIPPEARIARARKAALSQSPEQRSERARSTAAKRTPEERSEMALRAWRTKRGKRT